MKYEIGDMLYCIQNFVSFKEGRTYRISGFGTDIDYQTYYSLTSDYDGIHKYIVPETEVSKNFITLEQAYKIKNRNRRITEVLE